MTTYVNIGSGGADTWQNAEATLGDFPGTAASGAVKLARDTGNMYFWTGSMWSLIGAGAGAINIENIVSITDGSSASSGEITQVLTNAQSSPTTSNVGASGVFGQVISLGVPAGRWAISGIAGFDDNGATLTTAIEAAISASATGAGLAISDIVKDDSVSGATLSRSFALTEVYATLGSTTTYYVNTKFTYSAGTPQHFGKIVARRIG